MLRRGLLGDGENLAEVGGDRYSYGSRHGTDLYGQPSNVMDYRGSSEFAGYGTNYYQPASGLPIMAGSCGSRNMLFNMSDQDRELLLETMERYLGSPNHMWNMFGRTQRQYIDPFEMGRTLYRPTNLCGSGGCGGGRGRSGCGGAGGGGCGAGRCSNKDEFRELMSLPGIVGGRGGSPYPVLGMGGESMIARELEGRKKEEDCGLFDIPCHLRNVGSVRERTRGCFPGDFECEQRNAQRRRLTNYFTGYSRHLTGSGDLPSMNGDESLSEDVRRTLEGLNPRDSLLGLRRPGDPHYMTRGRYNGEDYPFSLGGLGSRLRQMYREGDEDGQYDHRVEDMDGDYYTDGGGEDEEESVPANPFSYQNMRRFGATI